MCIIAAIDFGRLLGDIACPFDRMEALQSSVTHDMAVRLNSCCKAPWAAGAEEAEAMARSNLLDAAEELEGYRDPKEVARRRSAQTPCLDAVWTAVVEHLLEVDTKEVEELEQLFGRKVKFVLLKLENLIGPMLVESLTSMDETGDSADSRHVLCLTKHYLGGRF